MLRRGGLRQAVSCEGTARIGGDRGSPTLLVTCVAGVSHRAAWGLQLPRDHLQERLSAGGGSSGAGAGQAGAWPAREPPRDGPTTQAVQEKQKREKGKRTHRQ